MGFSQLTKHRESLSVNPFVVYESIARQTMALTAQVHLYRRLVCLQVLVLAGASTAQQHLYSRFHNIAMLPTIDSKAIFNRFVDIIQGTAQQLSPQPPKTYYGVCFLCSESLQQPPFYTGAPKEEQIQACLTPDALTELPGCGHYFHHKCFNVNKHTVCPICRRPYIIIRISQATEAWIYQCPPHFVRWLSFWSMVLERRRNIPSFSPWRLFTKFRDPKCSFFMPGDDYYGYVR